MPIDKRNILDNEPFSYQVTKENLVFLFWYHRHIKTLQGKAAQSFLAKITEADQKAAQLLMAKATGNFKRGNERKHDYGIFQESGGSRR